MQALDLSNPPLAGTQLIEASAGTGKTYTLAALYLHLLLAGRRVEQILVMTFTKAATAELHARIRASVQAALDAYTTGTASDPLLQTLLDRYPDHSGMAWRLRLALRSFEQAAIYTIHGFCQRVLHDFPLTAGQPPGLTLNEDTRAMQQAIAEDFWRREITGAHPVVAAHLLNTKLTPFSLLAELPGKLQSYESVRTATPPPIAPIWAQLCSTYTQARALWPDGALKAALWAAAGDLNQSTHKPRLLEGALQALDTLLLGETPPFSPSEGYHRLGFAKLNKACTKKAPPAPRLLIGHPLWALLDALAAQYTTLTQALEAQQWWLFAQLRAYCLKELPMRSQRQQEFGFDDLPRTLRNALTHTGAQRLAARLRARYPAALVDEFQDTDTEQLQILTALYAQQPDTVLYLVGDPKQAIYRFRGADLYGYLKARHLASAQYHLHANYRATPSLLQGLNALYTAHFDPFLQPEITYHPVQAGHPAGHYTRLSCAGAPQAPWQLWWLNRMDQPPLAKEGARERVLARLAEEIVTLLTCGCIESGTSSRRVVGSDIAILVRAHRHADAVRAALTERGIASAQLGAVSVFTSDEAEALWQLLAAILDPAQESTVKGTLPGPFYGLDAAALAVLDVDEAAWERCLENFWTDHATWQQQGFMAMFHAWLWREHVATQLLSQPEGERRLTNLLHLAELLHQEAHQHGLGPHALLRWFQQQRQAAKAAPRTGTETHELRLESDAHRVRILTLHKSKGLEFNLVFCPLLWDEGGPPQNRAYHEAPPDYTSVLDLTGGTLPEAAALETQAESARLVYVALTRAKLCCYLSFGIINEGNSTALARLFQPWLGSAGEDYTQRGDAILMQRFRTHADAAAPGSWALTSLPADLYAAAPRSIMSMPESATPLQALNWNRTLHPGWWMTSFTALLDQEQRDGEHVQPDDAPRVRVPEAAKLRDWADIQQFPRGRATGNCWHSLLERLDFSRTEPGYRNAQVAKALTVAGFDPEWQPAVTTMLGHLLDTPRPEFAGIALSQLAPEHILRELEFHFSGAQLIPEQLTRLLEKHGYPELAVRTHAAAPWGIVHGYIDLVVGHRGRYYLGDYKSNWLGPEPSAYANSKLEPFLRAEGYTLQALLYTLALHRYLRFRLPDYAYEQHYGGMGFFFLRGVTPADPTQGVLLLRPEFTVIEALDAYFSPA